MNNLKAVLVSFVIYVVVFFFINLLFIHDTVSKAVISTTLSALGFCLFMFLIKPILKRFKAKS